MWRSAWLEERVSKEGTRIKKRAERKEHLCSQSPPDTLPYYRKAPPGWALSHGGTMVSTRQRLPQALP